MGVDRMYSIYMAIRVVGRARAREVAELAGVPLRSTYRLISRLLEAGVIARERRGMSVFYRVSKNISKDDLIDILGGSRGAEAPVYDLAFRIKRILVEYRIHGDLVGAAKIHMEVPNHQRITHDVDVVVAREWARITHLLLRDVLGLAITRSGGVHIDYN